MMRRLRKPSVFLLLSIAAIAGLACSKSGAKKLEGMVYEIAVYPAAKFDYRGDGLVLSEGPELHSRCWFFKPVDSKEKIIAFYRDALPNAVVTIGPGGFYALDEGEAYFVSPIAGGDPGEHFTVQVRKDELAICELISASKKHRRG
jgi:hypothetical protein